MMMVMMTIWSGAALFHDVYGYGYPVTTSFHPFLVDNRCRRRLESSVFVKQLLLACNHRQFTKFYRNCAVGMCRCQLLRS